MLLRVDGKRTRPVTGRGRRLSDHFAEAAGGCGSLEQLRTLLADAARDLGFDHFALLDHPSLERPRPGLVRLDDYPDAWGRELQGLAADIGDPVHLASRRSNTGFGWCELRRLVRLERGHKAILARSRHHGLGGGFTVPANVPGEPPASCSFAVRVGRELPVARLDCAERVGAEALRAARRLRPCSAGPLRPRLSRRELQCLRLVAMGKTDWEIGIILGISVETVHQYVKRARAAYGVVSRTQLVVLGLRDDWLSFGEALPPSG